MQGEKHLMLQEGVRICIARWAAFQLWLNQCLGGDASLAANLQHNVVHFLSTGGKGKEMEDFLQKQLEGMESAYKPDFQDGSTEAVAEEVCRLYEDCSRGDFERVRFLYHTLQTSAPPRCEQIIPENDDEMEDDDDEWLPDAADVGTKNGLSEEDIANGWQMVRRKK